MSPRPPVVCVGASVRALAWSAAAAGLRPLAFDLFADADLRAICDAVGGTVTQVPDLDDGLLAAVADAEPAPLIFAGAMETRPAVVNALAAGRPVWGVAGPALAAARDPLAVQRAAAAAGFRPLAVSLDGPTADATLWKPLNSAGGLHIGDPQPGRPGYWQESAVGRSLSVQLAGGRVFGFAHHISPHPHADLAVSRDPHPPWADRAAALASSLSLRGLVGVDVIDTPEGPAVVEINPRITASFELTERLTGRSAVALLAAEFGGQADAVPKLPSAAPALAKRVLFAPADITAGRLSSPNALLADVPPPGTFVPAGHPLCTLITEAPDIPTAAARLSAAVVRND